jgi:hypothetical protein
MSWRASGYVKELQECPNGELISCHEKCVAFVLADSHQDKTGLYTYPSLETIARDARVDTRTCRRLLAALERKGIIERIQPEHYGRGLLTFYSFPALDQAREINGRAHIKGGQDARLCFAKRGAKGGQKGDKTVPHTKGRTVTGTQKQKIPPYDPPVVTGGWSKPNVPAPGLFDDEPTPAGNGPPGEARAAIERAIEQTMSGCSWTKKRLREKLRAVIRLECDKGQAAATTALAIMAAWKCQAENSRLLRGKFGPANFLELGIWKDSNLLLWDHARVEMNRGGARL